MAWIELHQSVFRHPKTERLARALGLQRVQVVGYLASLWCWALDALPEAGGPISQEDAALGAEWPGDPLAFFSALTEAGYIEQRRGAGRFYLRNWRKYAGRLIERRVFARERKRRERAKANLNVTRDSLTTVTPTNTTNQPTQPTTPTNPPGAAGVGVGKAPTTEALRGPPYDVIAACENYLGRCLEDWYAQLGNLKARYSPEELEHGFSEAHKRHGRTPRYVEQVIEGSRVRVDDNGAGPQGASVSGLKTYTPAEYAEARKRAAPGGRR